MPLEPATHISDLVITNPTGGDPKSQGDDHLRLIKSVLQNTFPSLVGAAAWLTGTPPVSFVTGDVKQAVVGSQSSEWIPMRGGTIGNTGSGATFESATYEAIFNILKAFAPNAGTEDFASLNTVVVPDMRDRFGVGDSGSVSIGDTGGSADLQSHTHGGGSLNAASATAEYIFSAVGSVGTNIGRRVGGTTEARDGDEVTSSGGKVTAHTHNISGSVDSTGAGNAGNIPPFVAFAWFVHE